MTRLVMHGSCRNDRCFPGSIPTQTFADHLIGHAVHCCQPTNARQTPFLTYPLLQGRHEGGQRACTLARLPPTPCTRHTGARNHRLRASAHLRHQRRRLTAIAKTEALSRRKNPPRKRRPAHDPPRPRDARALHRLEGPQSTAQGIQAPSAASTTPGKVPGARKADSD